MTQISDEHKDFFKQVLIDLFEKKTKDLDSYKNKIADYKEKIKNLPVDNSVYAKSQALEGYVLEYIKTYNDLVKLKKELES